MMRSRYPLLVLLILSLYWMYRLYEPFLLSIVIGALLAISTSNINRIFERHLHSPLASTILSTVLLAMVFIAPLGYFLTTFTLKLNTISPEMMEVFFTKLTLWINKVPDSLAFIKPYMSDALEELSISNLATNALAIATKVGAFSATFVKNALLIIVFYFFALYYGRHIEKFLRQVTGINDYDAMHLNFELSSVMGVVFYSIVTTAIFEGSLFGIMISLMGYNGLLFGIMYGFASLVPVVGGALMWVPFVLLELSKGNSSGAIIIALYSIIVISIIADTFIKPIIIKEINQRMIKTDTKINELIIFFAIIAGLSSFGFWGMILGPAITSFFLSVVKLFETHRWHEKASRP